MGGKHKKKSGGLSVIWIPGRRSHKYKTINNRHNINKDNISYHSARVRNITGTHNAAYSDMMSGDSTLPLPSPNTSELKIDVNPSPATTTVSTTGVDKQDKSVQSDETTVAVLVDTKPPNGKPDVEINDTIGGEKEPLNKDNASQNGNEDATKTTDQFLTMGNSDKTDGVFKLNNDVMKVKENEEVAGEQEECVVKCLYYTIQCCECAIQ